MVITQSTQQKYVDVSAEYVTYWQCVLKDWICSLASKYRNAE